jgi:hypothetical protein
MPRPGWYNDNANRTFPFVEGTAGIPYSGTLSEMVNLPDYFIVDCGFIMGPESAYVEGNHFIYLYRVARSGNVVEFEFRSTDPIMATTGLKFTRTVTDEDYTLEYLDSDSPDDPVSESDSDTESCEKPFWSGYLITGDMSLVGEAIADSVSITSSGIDEGFVEPTLIQNLAGSAVVSIGLANTDRTRVVFEGGTENPCYAERPQWDFNTDCGTDSEERPIRCTYEYARCLTGDVRFQPGYNMTIAASPSTNTILFSPIVGAGEGEPCEEVKLFPTETPPIDATNNVLEGSILCNELLRSINGHGGPLLQFRAGTGVVIIPDPDNSKIVIDINLNNLDLCQFSEYSIG